MKSKELVRLLQEIDPGGETEVVFGCRDITFLQKEPMYYDGLPITLIRDKSKRPYYDVIGFRATSKGNKIKINVMDYEDVLWQDPNCIIELEDDYAKKHYEKDIERVKKEVLEEILPF